MNTPILSKSGVVIPCYLIFLKAQVRGQINDTCSVFDFNVSLDHLVGPLDFEDAIFSLVSFIGIASRYCL